MNEHTPSPEAPSNGRRTNLGLLVLQMFIVLAVGGVIVSAFLPLFGRTSPFAHETRARAAIKNVLLACREYAADNEDGTFPPDLAALVPDYIDDSAALFVDDGRGAKFPMIYHPGFHSTSDPETIVIESPVRFTGNRVVGTVGGYIRQVPVD